MAILVKPDTKVLVQGITGEFGARHAKLSLEYGSAVVAGVTPGKGGQVFEHAGAKVPIFDTVAEAVKQTGATASAVFVPPPFAADAPSERWSEELHGFSWLRHFTTAHEANNGDAARRYAQKLVADWIETEGDWHEIAWRPQVIGRRLMS